MFGSVGAWFFEHVAGVRLPPKAERLGQGARGWQRIVYDATVLRSAAGSAMCDSLSWANATETTVRGVVSGSWSCFAGGGVVYEVRCFPSRSQRRVPPI